MPATLKVLCLKKQAFGGGGIIFLTNNRNTLTLYNWLLEQEKHIILFSGKLKSIYFVNYKPDIIISYNYKYLIDESIIELNDHKIMNLHISLLPWNKGSDPNFWSFIENTPKGVTIHQIDKGLDTGDVIIQQEYVFNESKETLKSTYEFLHKEIQRLFIENWDNIKRGKILPRKQDLVGSYHTKKEFFTLTKDVQIEWGENISKLKSKFPDRS